ncbi:RICIN domain-containing protein [Micromonospora sp. CPCC 205711]|uniref:RICIN domain-containing protein n=1 Tax=Micromonospora sp. CPCC 205547 TaxID=3122400 RepID=UPI002FF31C33
MSVPDEHHDPTGTVYGARPAARRGLPRDPLMRVALATGLVGALLGVFFATGVLGGGGDPSVLPAAAAPAPPTTAPTTAPTVDAAAPTTISATLSPTAAPTTPPPPAPAAPAPVTGPKVIRAVTSGLCVAPDGDGEQATARLAPCTGGPEQQWVANPVAADVVTLTNAAYGQCLDVSGGGVDDGAKLQQFGCHGQPNQQWKVTPVGTGPVLLVSVQSGRCAQVRDARTDPGAELIQTGCTAGAEQQWALG